MIVSISQGLGNRLSLFSLAHALSVETGRQLQVLWRPDSHCTAAWEELFEPTLRPRGAARLRDKLRHSGAHGDHCTKGGGSTELCGQAAATGGQGLVLLESSDPLHGRLAVYGTPLSSSNPEIVCDVLGEGLAGIHAETADHVFLNGCLADVASALRPRAAAISEFFRSLQPVPAVAAQVGALLDDVHAAQAHARARGRRLRVVGLHMRGSHHDIRTLQKHMAGEGPGSARTAEPLRRSSRQRPRPQLGYRRELLDVFLQALALRGLTRLQRLSPHRAPAGGSAAAGFGGAAVAGRGTGGVAAAAGREAARQPAPDRLVLSFDSLKIHGEVAARPPWKGSRGSGDGGGGGGGGRKRPVTHTADEPAALVVASDSLRAIVDLRQHLRSTKGSPHGTDVFFLPRADAVASSTAAGIRGALADWYMLALASEELLATAGSSFAATAALLAGVQIEHIACVECTQQFRLRYFMEQRVAQRRQGGTQGTGALPGLGTTSELA